MKRMQLVQRVKNRKFLFRLCCYFGVLLALTVSLVTAICIDYGRKVESQYREKIQTNLRRASASIDDQLQTIQNLGLNFFSTGDVRQNFKPSVQRTLAMEAEQWRIVKVISQNKAIFGDALQNIYVYFREDNQVYTPAGVYELDFFFENICSYENYPRSFWQGETPLANDGVNVFAVSDMSIMNSGTVQVFPVTTSRRVGGENAVYVANLYAERVEEILTVSSVLEDTRFLIIDSEGKLVEDTMEEAGVVDTVRLLDAAGERGFGECRINNERYMVFKEVSSGYGWSYLAIVPNSRFSQTLYINMVYMMALGIGMVGLSILLSVMFASRIYRPINSMVEKLDRRAEPETDIDEMAYLQQGVSRLLENKKQYESSMNRYNRKYVEHSLQLALNGIAVKRQWEIEDILGEQYGFLYSSYVCCSIIFDFTPLFYQEIAERNQSEMQEKFYEILDTLVSNLCKCCIVEMMPGNYTCIANVEPREQLQELCQRLSRLEKNFSPDSSYYTVSIGIGSICGSLKDISVSQSQAVYAQQNRRKKDSFQIICYDDLSVKRQVSFTFYDQKKLVNCIKTGKEENLEKLIEGILTENRQRGVSSANMTELYRQLWSAGKRCLDEQGLVLEDERFEIRIRQEFLEDKEVEFDTAAKFLREYLYEVLKLVSRQEGNEGNRLIPCIKQYIDANYMEDLSLETLGTELGISAKYMSRMFKQKTGENLTDYINNVRIEKARDILRNTNTKIGDIAGLVGLESRTTFLRVFKKLEGISPNEYRNINRRED